MGNKMKYYIYYLSVFLFTFISCNKEENYYSYGMNFLEHTDKYEKENNLVLNLYGINTNWSKNYPSWNNIHLFRTTFYCIENLNLEQTRKKIIHATQEFLFLINSNKSLKPFLYKYPFTYNELHFIIIFNKKNGDYVDKNFISKCTLNDGTINYYTTSNPKELAFDRIHKETYEEALEILKREESKISK